MMNQDEKLQEIMNNPAEAREVLTLLENAQYEIESLKMQLENAQAAALPVIDIDKYYLIDLERTIHSGAAFFWCPNSRGYTRDAAEAGEYSGIQAKEKILGDFDRRTVAISLQDYQKLFLK